MCDWAAQLPGTLEKIFNSTCTCSLRKPGFSFCNTSLNVFFQWYKKLGGKGKYSLYIVILLLLSQLCLTSFQAVYVIEAAHYVVAVFCWMFQMFSTDQFTQLFSHCKVNFCILWHCVCLNTHTKVCSGYTVSVCTQQFWPFSKHKKERNLNTWDFWRARNAVLRCIWLEDWSKVEDQHSKVVPAPVACVANLS